MEHNTLFEQWWRTCSRYAFGSPRGMDYRNELLAFPTGHTVCCMLTLGVELMAVEVLESTR